jgi:GNAT superfamily N-acetyltransferase
LRYNYVVITIQTFTGKNAEPYISDLARLRITVFRDYPYLYEGDLDYEKDYLQAFVASEKSFMVIVFDDEQVVGTSTAMPLVQEHDEFKQPFIEKVYRLEDIFYFGESLLLPAYRGQGLGVKFFEEREAHARSQGYKLAAFCAVERPEDHLAKPQNYQPLHAFWRKRGFERQSDLVTSYSWKDVGETEPSAKPMVFWLKEL